MNKIKDRDDMWSIYSSLQNFIPVQTNNPPDVRFLLSENTSESKNANFILGF